jgi:hypothetical protein
LFKAAVSVDHRRDHVVDREISRDARASGSQAVVNQHAFEPAQRASAHVVRDAYSAKTERSRTADYIPRKILVMVPLDRKGRHLLGGK